MSKGIEDQLRGLEREQSRLEVLLAPDPDWQAYQAALAGGDAAHALAALPESAAESLRESRLFNAHVNIVRARELLAELLPPRPAEKLDNTIAAGSAPASEVSKPFEVSETSEVSGTEAGDMAFGDASAGEIGDSEDPSSDGGAEASPTSFRTKIKVKRHDRGEDRGGAEGSLVAKGLGAPVLAQVPALEPGDLETVSRQRSKPSPAAGHSVEPGRVGRHAAPLLAALVSRRRSRLDVLGLLVAQLRHQPDVAAPALPCSAEDDASVTPSAAAMPPSVAALPKPANDDEPGRIEHIEGLTEHHRQVLAGHGVTVCSQIARWTAEDVSRFNALLEPDADISGGQWIEQAAMLAAGKSTKFSRRQADRYFECLVERPVDVAWEPAHVGHLRWPLDHPEQPSKLPSELTLELIPTGQECTVAAIADDAVVPTRCAPGVSEIRVGEIADHDLLHQSGLLQAGLNIRIKDLEQTVALIRSSEVLSPEGGAAVPQSVREAVMAGGGAVVRTEPHMTGGEMPEQAVCPSVCTGVAEAVDRLAVVTAPRDEEPASGERIIFEENEPDVEIVIVRREEAVTVGTGAANTCETEAIPSTSWFARRMASYDVDETEGDAMEHAAYKGTTMEASVQIVRRADADKDTRLRFASTPLQPPLYEAPQKRGFSRFLRALTGD